MGTVFITDITIKQTKYYLDDDGTGVKPKNFLQRVMIYTPGYDPIQQMRDKYWIIATDNFVIKVKSTGNSYPPRPKFCGAGVHLTMSSCLKDAIINSTPSIGKYIDK